MGSKNEAEVIIGGKILTLSGFESQEYLQKVATYLNNKLAEFMGEDSFKKLSGDYQSILLQINIADDYFKAMKQIEMLESEIKAKEKEVFDLKHELITSQIKIENMEKSGKTQQSKVSELEKKIIRLETELREAGKK